MRVDILIHALIIYILPSIFEERRLISEQNRRIAALVRLLPGGTALLEQKNQPKVPPTIPKIAYLVPDPQRDARGKEMVANGQISTPVLLPGNVGMTLTSYSSNSLAVDTHPTLYTIRIGFNGVVSCICKDFTRQGGACKHIRGALFLLDDLRMRGMKIPHIPIPQSFAGAQALQAEAVLTITIRPSKADLPTSHAAEKLEDILREDDTCMESDCDADDGADDDNASVAGRLF
jgi:hypothetical protein